MPSFDLEEILAAKPTRTKRVEERLEELINHPNPYNYRPDFSDLRIGEQAAWIRALDGYGLRHMLERRWGEEQAARLWLIANDKTWVYDPLEVIQEIP